MSNEKKQCDLVVPNDHHDKQNNRDVWFSKKRSDLPAAIAPDSCVCIDVRWVSNRPERHEEISSQHQTKQEYQNIQDNVHVQLL